MKKLVLVLVVLFVSVVVASATIFEKIKPCTLYDVPSKDIMSGASVDAISEDCLFVNIGLVTEGETGIPFGGLNVDLQKLSAKMGWVYHLPEPLKIGMFYSRNFKDSTNLYGLFFGFPFNVKK